MHHQARAQQIRRCLQAMTDQQINQGLTAFEDGESCWSSCFWARVFPDTNLYNLEHGYTNKAGKRQRLHYAIEWWIADQLGLPSHVPVRIVYNLFDGCSKTMTPQQLADFIRRARLEGDHSAEVLDLLRSLPDLDKETTWNDPIRSDASCSVRGGN